MNNTCLVLFPQTSDQLQILIFRSLSIFSLNLANFITFYRCWRNLFVTNLRNKKRKRKKKHEFEMTYLRCWAQC